MSDLGSFDPTQHGDPTDFEPLPAGRYLAIVEASEEKTTKAGDGSYLEFKFQVVDGPHKGRRLWARITRKNASAEAVMIADKQLASLCRAVEVLRPKDSAQLHDRPLCVAVKIEKRKDTGEFTNRIVGFYNRKDLFLRAEPQAGTPAPHFKPVEQVAPVAASAAPPWKR